MFPPIDCTDLLSTLNPEQLAAVTAENRGSLLVLAGAGCGKTAVLTRRIVYLTRLGVKPDRICALTFSRKAADEMAHRLSTLDPACSVALVTTFHAFALRVLMARHKGIRNFSRIGFDGKVKLLDGKERHELIALSSSANLRKFLRMGIVELSGALDLLETFPEKAAKKWDGEEMALLAKVSREFSAMRKERALWDFSDLINGCIDLFGKYPDVAAEWAGRFDAVLVDEFQDTNPMQIEMLDILLKSGSSLYAVGDDDQAIYGFRGADIRPIRNFTSRFNEARIAKLQINYRSVTAILECANRLWVDKPAEYRKTLTSGLRVEPTGIRKPQTMRFFAQAQALEWILGKARFLARREKIPIGEMAILFRINDTLSTAFDHFRGLGLSDADTPQLLTVHASKGLEYPVVFILDLEEGVFPHYKMPKESSIDSWVEFVRAVVKPKPSVGTDCDLEEELRLFYVAVTRAQRYLFFVTVAKKQFYGRETKFGPSRFLRLVR